MCHCGKVVIDKELLALVNPVRPPATLFSVSLYRFFFSVWSLYFNTIFPFGPFFSLFLLLTVLVMHLDQYTF